jgi:hypothetical protein
MHLSSTHCCGQLLRYPVDTPVNTRFFPHPRQRSFTCALHTCWPARFCRNFVFDLLLYYAPLICLLRALWRMWEFFPYVALFPVIFPPLAPPFTTGIPILCCSGTHPASSKVLHFTAIRSMHFVVIYHTLLHIIPSLKACPSSISILTYCKVY